MRRAANSVNNDAGAWTCRSGAGRHQTSKRVALALALVGSTWRMAHGSQRLRAERRLGQMMREGQQAGDRATHGGDRTSKGYQETLAPTLAQAGNR